MAKPTLKDIKKTAYTDREKNSLLRQESQATKPINKNNNKVGRPGKERNPKVRYIKTGFLIPENLHTEVKMALLQSFKSRHKTLDDFYCEAVKFYLQNGK